MARTIKRQNLARKLIFCLGPVFFSIGADSAQSTLFVYEDQTTHLFGFKDAGDKVSIEAKFKSVHPSEGSKVFSHENEDTEFLVPVLTEEGWRRMTAGRELKFKTVFFDNGPDYYAEGLARFLNDNNKVGFHDRRGTVVVEPVYDFASPFREGRSNVCNGCHAEYESKPTYLPLSASPCQQPREDMYLSVVGGQWGQIDTQGNIIVPLEFSYEEMMEKSAKH